MGGKIKILMAESDVLTKGDLDFSELEALGRVVYGKQLSEDELKSELRDADAVLVNKTVLSEALLSEAEKLRYVGECATGYENIDIAYCHAHGITVSNVPGYSTNAVAQEVFAFILQHFSKTVEYNQFVHSGGWIKSSSFSPLVFDTDEICGKTIGLVGYGKIGRAVARIADAFGMNVLVYTRSYARALKAKEEGKSSERTFLDGFLNRTDNFVTYVSFDRLLKYSDIISLHCPLNEESEDLFDAETFRRMKKGAFFINTSRGRAVNEADLAETLKSGHLSGAALDVLRQEPMASDCPLLGIENCIIAPHAAWTPFTTRKRLLEELTANLAAFLNGSPKNVV